jgi:hypothetical protein
MTPMTAPPATTNRVLPVDNTLYYTTIPVKLTILTGIFSTGIFKGTVIFYQGRAKTGMLFYLQLPQMQQRQG